MAKRSPEAPASAMLVDLAGRPAAAALFDMDGTLVDSEGVAGRALDALLAGRGVDVAASGRGVSEAEMCGVPWRRVAELVAAAHPGALAGASTDQIAAELLRRFDEALAAQLPPLLGGAAAAVRAAAALREGPTVAVVTSSNRSSAERVLEGHDLRRHVDVLVCAEDVARGKPDPQPFLLGAERLGREPSRCVAFEDSVAGVRAARDAGMRVVAITGAADAASAASTRALAHAHRRDFAALTGEEA